MRKPLVSVFMITYNHETFIAEAIESVLMQKASFAIELVIGEDCSTDRTAEIVKEYADKYPDIIKARFNSPNIGMIPNMIKTLEECTGKYIAMLEGDDYWTDPLKLQKQVDFLEENKEFVICFHKVKLLKNVNLVDDFKTKVPKENSTIMDLCKGNYMHTCSVVFKNKLLTSFPDWFYQVKIGDYPLHMLNAQWGLIKYLDENMAVYRLHNGGVFSNSSFKNGYIETLRVDLYLLNSFESTIRDEFIDKILKKNSELIDLLMLYKNSTSYKVGNFIFSPIRVFKKIMGWLAL